MTAVRTPEIIDIPVDPITGPAGIVPPSKPAAEDEPDPLRGPLGDTAAEPHENEG